MTSTDRQDLVARIADLERRLAAVEATKERRFRGRWAGALASLVILGGAAYAGASAVNQGPQKGLKVTAPFIVVDDKGELITVISTFHDAHRGLVAFDAKGNQRLSLDTGSGFDVYATDGSKQVAHLGAAASDGGGVLTVSNAASQLTAVLSRDSGGKAGLLSLLRPGASAVAQLGESGAVVMGPTGTPVGRLGGASPRGVAGGYLVLANSGGDALVEAGSLTPQFGVVRTYPLGGAPPIPIPNFLVGHGWVQQSGHW